MEVAGSIDPDRAARQLVRFLAALHHPAGRQRAEAAVGPLTGPQLPPAMTRTLRERLGTLVMDFENIGAAEPEYELRGFPGPGMGLGLELLTAIMRHYQQVTGRQLLGAYQELVQD
jgi:hypothetical protein